MCRVIPVKHNCGIAAMNPVCDECHVTQNMPHVMTITGDLLISLNRTEVFVDPADTEILCTSCVFVRFNPGLSLAKIQNQTLFTLMETESSD